MKKKHIIFALLIIAIALFLTGIYGVGCCLYCLVQMKFTSLPEMTSKQEWIGLIFYLPLMFGIIKLRAYRKRKKNSNKSQ